MNVVEIVVGVVLIGLGFRSLVHWVRSGIELRRPSEAVWFALFVLGRVGCWWGLAGIFLISASIPTLGRALIDDWSAYAWFILVPLGAGGLQLIAAWFLRSDGERDEASVDRSA